MSRRVSIATTVTVLLLGAGLLWTQGSRLAHASWARTGSETLSGPVAEIRNAPSPDSQPKKDRKSVV